MAVTRPAGFAPGAMALGAAWGATVIIALLTGSTAVVILLAVGVVLMAAALVSGWRAIRRASVIGIATGDVAVAGEKLDWTLIVTARSSIQADVKVAGQTVASGTVVGGSNVVRGTAPSRGVHTAAEVRWRSAGRLGLFWWRRRAMFDLEDLAVAPAIGDLGAPILHATDLVGDHSAAAQVGRGEVDGVRPWRDGDEVNAVHWPSSIRAGEFVVRQRQQERDEQWVVLATSATQDPDAEASRVRNSLERGRAAGAGVAVRLDGGSPVVLGSKADVLVWTASFDPRPAEHGKAKWWTYRVRVNCPDADPALTRRARWTIAACGAAPLVMLLQPLGYAPAQIGGTLAATAVGAITSIYAAKRLLAIRQLVAVVTAVAVGAMLVDLSEISSVVSSLRFLLPQLLVALVVLQGFECIDKRAARVSVGCAAVLVSYSAGVRVDAELGVWLLVAVIGLAAGVRSIDRPPAPPAASRGRRAVGHAGVRVAGMVTCALAVLVILAVVPVPRGPVQLTLPSWLEERRPTGGDGALAAPDGSPLLGAGFLSGNRSSGAGGAGGAGGYPGFSTTMDTALRGDLGNEVVLRVRSPYSDFWRGQTFSRFDGRSWYVSEDVGTRSEGPDHDIQRATGDVNTGQPGDFIQTFYAEVDLPNIVFAANRPTRVLLDAPLWQRPDGALRADVVLPAGSAYTVVSQRSLATAEGLRAEGDLARIDSPPEYVEVPESATQRTIDLAESLSAGSASTYDTILAIQEWLEANVEYDLDAPVPGQNDDAVDHFLFESQRGFCEQIATATAIMLRSLGVAARVATGYVPSSRDEIAGVWISRASDAHAWVEVRFPNFGWVAFDPTASVPLSGEADASTIGGDLFKALFGAIGDHVGELIVVILTVGCSVVALRALRRLYRRHRRGRWGVLQDRFDAAAIRRGAAPSTANAHMAAVFDSPEAAQVAQALDASAFSLSWTDDDEQFRRAAAAVDALERAATVATRVE